VASAGDVLKKEKKEEWARQVKAKMPARWGRTHNLSAESAEKSKKTPQGKRKHCEGGHRPGMAAGVGKGRS